jgi:hypothetical protein
MTKYFLIALGVLLTFTGCKTLPVNQTQYKTTTQHVALGSIGVDKALVTTGTFKSAALPNYKKPIKVQATVVPFTKGSYKAYMKAKTLQSKLTDSSVVAALLHTPKYVALQIADKIALLEALNAANNKEVKSYVGYNTASAVVTNVSVSYDEANLKAIQDADAIFLVEPKLKTYALQLYKNGEKAERILLSKGVVFGYKAAQACWQDSRQHDLQIIDVIPSCNRCPKKTFKSSVKAKAKRKLF